MTQITANSFLKAMPHTSRVPEVSREFGISQKHLFWKLQIASWVAYGGVRWAFSVAQGRDPDKYLPVIISAIVGFCLTLLIRYTLKHVWRRGIGWVLGLSVPLIAISASFYSASEIHLFTTYYDPDWVPHPRVFVGMAIIQSFMLTAWLGLYVGLKFYMQYREESNHVLRMTAMAHQAQLAMLRYQLNPHFLFNTLNAISTLVLENRNALAVRMLDKLSAFLRYSLVNQPTEKVTLTQEIDALNLYLDIEKVRFEDRLDVRVQIEGDANEALVPSLLLQPLIENAIKYAIAPDEDGGVITVNAQHKNGRLKLRVADTGPGIPASGAVPSKTGSGVGLANTRERLEQLYENDFTFEMSNRARGGLAVAIDIPFETRALSSNL